MDKLTTALTAVVLALAVVAGLVLPPPSENTEPAPVPGVGELVALRDEALAQTADALEDRSGLRSIGVQADRWVRQEVIGQRIFEQHVVGEAGWLFYRPTIERACSRADPAPSVRRATSRLRAVGAAAGLEVLVVIPPDKAAVYPQMLGPFEEEGNCVAAQARSLAGLGAPVITGFHVVLQQAMAEGQPPVYFPGDTHWRHTAAAAVSREVFRFAAPAMLEQLDFTTEGEATRELDLERFSGRTVEETEPVWAVRPRGATVVEESQEGAVGHYVTAGPSVPDRTVVLVRDSFGASMLPSLKYLGSTLEVCDCVARIDGRAAPLLPEADLLILQIVQRHARLRLIRQDAPGQLATALGDRLAGTPLTISPDGAVELPSTGLVRFVVEGEPDAVRLRTRDGDVVRELLVAEGQVSSLFVEDVDESVVWPEVQGGSLVAAEAIDVG